jgi:hypothetical protein
MSKLGYFDSIISDAGRPIVATITVFDAGTATPSAIYTTAAGITLKANPFTTDALGRFQFFAAGGTYDLEVSGAGITTYKIENLSLALTGPAGPAGSIDGVTPEYYGAVGDGTTDDYTAFAAMFTALAGMSADTRKKVILNPTVYYRIASRKNSTNVFEIDVDDIIFIGKGTKNLCLQYEGTATTNLFQFGTHRGLAFRDCYIRGDEVDRGIGGIGAKITNIIYGGNLIDFHADYCTFREASGGTFEGFGWNMFWSQVEANSMGYGFKAGLTTTTFTNCYANACTIGYWCFEPFDLAITGCACDHADAAYVIGGHTGSIRGSECEDCKQAVVSGGSQHGLTHDGPKLDIAGCLFRGRLGNDTQADADLAFIDLAYGNYSIKSVSVELIPAMTNAGVGNPLDGNNQYWLRSRLVSGDNHCIVDGSIPKKYISDYFTFNSGSPYYGPPVQVLVKDLNYFGELSINANALAAALVALNRSDLGNEVDFIVAEASTATLTPPFRLFEIGGPACGRLEVCMYATTHAVLTVTPGLSFAAELLNITIPLVFKKIDFTVLTGADVYPLFKIRNCRSLSFLDCKFTSAQAMKIFSFDITHGAADESQLILDKATMDAITGPWNGLSENNRPEQIKFIGYADKPTAGIFDTGCRIEFMAPASGGHIGCICTYGGTPGTWKYYGTIE